MENRAIVKKVLGLVEELKVEEGKKQYVPRYYKRHGQMVRRSYDDIVYPKRYYELREELYKDKVFQCEDCGKMVSYGELEAWTCDFQEGEYICSCCYEAEQGEDL